MAEGLLIEIETPTGPARPGEMGSILVTDLLNRAMPLIRYRIGDLGMGHRRLPLRPEPAPAGASGRPGH